MQKTEKKKKNKLDGWVESSIEDIAERFSVPKIYREKQLETTGTIPVYDQSDKEIIRFHNGEPTFNASKKDPFLIFGDHTCRTQLIRSPFSVGPNVIPLQARDGYDTSFIYYLITGSIKQREYKRHWSELVARDFLIPKVEEQKRIAGFLSAFDEKIELNNKINKNLEEIAQAIFKHWFVDFKFPGHEKVKMIDSELGKIPEGWEVKKISDIAEVVLGGTPSRKNDKYWKGNIPWINSGEVNEFRILSASEFITQKGLDSSSAKLMPKRTTVLAITGATLGQVSLLEIPTSANQSVIGVYDKEGKINEFIYLLISGKIKEIILQAGGGAQQHINKQIVEDFKVLLSEFTVLNKFTTKVQPILDLISKNSFENQALSKMRDTLLPKLMRGEIRV